MMVGQVKMTGPAGPWRRGILPVYSIDSGLLLEAIDGGWIQQMMEAIWSKVGLPLRTLGPEEIKRIGDAAQASFACGQGEVHWGRIYGDAEPAPSYDV